MSGLSYEAQKMAEEAAASPDRSENPVSLDAMMEDNRSSTVKLVDDETGKPKIICKWTTTPGTLFKSKTCMTKNEWDEVRGAGKGTTDRIQRNLNIGAQPQ